MNLREISDLINIRDYICNSLSNASIDKSTISSLNSMMVLLDNKIISLLHQDNFKNYINYKDIKRAVNEINSSMNIKSGTIKKPL